MTERIAPTYFGPWQYTDWNRLMQSDAHPILNPSNGPGSPDAIAQYYTISKACDTRGKRVYGYIATNSNLARGPVPQTRERLIEEMQMYERSGLVDDIFFDEINFDNFPQQGVHAFARSHFQGRQPIYNAGVPVERKWYDKYPGSIMVTFENQQSRYSGDIGPLPDREMHLIYSCTEGLRYFGPGYRYWTADGMPNPWDSFNQ